MGSTTHHEICVMTCTNREVGTGLVSSRFKKGLSTKVQKENCRLAVTFSDTKHNLIVLYEYKDAESFCPLVNNKIVSLKKSKEAGAVEDV